MDFTFHKYHGTGNDFIVLDNRDLRFDATDVDLIASLCHRRFGIGADGLILLQHKAGFDFEMVYFNSDGRESSMCGNGGRCIVAFAQSLGVIEKSAHFLAIDGPHEATIAENSVSLKMGDVAGIERIGNDFFLDTGSPHYVAQVANLADLNLVEAARAVRYNERFSAVGTNVNYVEQQGDVLHVRTYERGVEDETLSCGTGVTAISLVAGHTKSISNGQARVSTPGGELQVAFEAQNNGGFSNIWLTGPASFVFHGVFSA